MKTKLTPIELQQQRFTTSFRGYNTTQVDNVLDEVSDTLESIMAENEELKGKVQALTSENHEFREREDSYKRLMLNSQAVLEQMKENARKSAELIVAQAEVDSGRIIQNTHDRLVRMQDEINELKRQKSQIRNQIKAILETHMELLTIQVPEIINEESEEIRQIGYE
jgi:cell division initiation protein